MTLKNNEKNFYEIYRYITFYNTRDHHILRNVSDIERQVNLIPNIMR